MPASFQKVEPVSKKARVVALLKEAILSGGIQAGEQIIEGKVAQQFGVGQGLIREALIELEHQGFVQRTPFSGTQVPKLNHEDARHIFDIRIELEPLAFALAAETVSAEDLAELRELSAKTAEAIQLGNMDRFFENHLAFRRVVWNRCANPYLLQALERLVIPLFALYVIRGSFNRQGLLQTARDCVTHQDMIVAAMEKKNVAEVRKVARQFLKTVWDRNCFRPPDAGSRKSPIVDLSDHLKTPEITDPVLFCADGCNIVQDSYGYHLSKS
jgi:DNA-binding GntR family transcriptional regulator